MSGEQDKDHRIRVAYVSPGWPQGACANGVVTYTAHMVAALLAMGHRPYVIARSIAEDSKENFVVAARSRGTERTWHERLLDYLGYRLAPSRWGPLSLAASLRSRIDRLVRDAGIHIVEMEEAIGLARRVCIASPVPVVVRLHGPEFLVGRIIGRTQDGVFRRRVRAEGLSIAGAAGVSAPSMDVLRCVREYYGLTLADAQVIPNPVAPVPSSDRWNPQGCERGRILFVGRFDRCKGADTMIKAFGRVARTCPFSRLTFVGPDHGLMLDQGRRWRLEPYLKRCLSDPHAHAQLEWLGTLPPRQVQDLRRRSMVTVVCSRYEVFGFTATEAMAAGCPLVVTNVGGLAEVAQDGRNALVCRPGDPEDLAQKLLILLNNPELAANLGRQAAIDVEQRYHPVVVAKQAMTFYRRVIEQVKRDGQAGSRIQSHS